MSSIFNDTTNQVKGNWVSWDKIGYKIEGTFVGKRKRINQLNGKEQWIYEIKDTNGEFWNIGGKEGIDAQMRYVKSGQIVGFEFKEERPARTAGFHPLKIIQVWANPKIVDEMWLKEQEEAVTDSTSDVENVNLPISQPVMTPADLATQKQQSTVTLTQTQKIEKIHKLATQKLQADGKDPQDIMVKVMEKTGLAFIEANFDQILNMLEMA